LHTVMIAPFGIRPKGTLLARMLPLARALQRRGQRVTIVAPPVQNPEDADTRVDHGGVPVIHTALPRLPGPAAVIEQSATLLYAALREAPDVVHLFKPKGYGGLAALTARITQRRLPLVVDTDDWEGPGGWNDLLPYPAPAKALFAWQERDLPCRAHAVTVASTTLESLVWGMGVPAKQVFLVPNGIEPERMLAVPAAQLDALRPPQMLLYTRFWELDVAELVAALTAIHQVRPDVRLVVVGRGEAGEEHLLAELAARSGITAMLDVRGWLEPGQIPAVLASCDLALAPIRDTLINRARGMAKLLELLVAGLPVVAGDVGMARAYLDHGAGGILVPPGNSGALAAAALHLLNDAGLRRAKAEGARTAATRYTWDSLAPAAEAAYRLAASTCRMR
jgi:glycosyltransferase involved in cell wall biosynthesis